MVSVVELLAERVARLVGAEPVAWEERAAPWQPRGAVEGGGSAVTIRPGGALAESGDAVFVAAPLTPAQATAYVMSQSSGCGLDPAAHDLRALAKAV